MENDIDLIYFDKNHPLLKSIKDYITYQCLDVCRNEIDTEVVSAAFKNFDFGYVRKIVRSKTGIINYNRKLKETVHSFVLCKYNYDIDNNISSVYIQVLCNSKSNSKNNKDGSKLLELIENKARGERIKMITLLALGEKSLKKWYEKHLFIVNGEINIPGTKTVKVYSMEKKLK
jgi:hypothetical protein